MGRGRRQVASPDQCAEVLRLAGEGVSIRQVAERVFGDARFRGRVERILRAPVALEPSADKERLLAEEAVSVETVPAVRLALRRYLIRVERGEVQPSVAEMVKLLDLERRLRAFEMVEEMNALTHAVDEEGCGT